MKTTDFRISDGRAVGFALPMVLVVMAALVALVIGLLSLTGNEQRSSRLEADRLRAGLAARAGLEEVRGMLLRECANDDFLVIAAPAEAGDAPVLYLSAHEGAAVGVYRHVPLFSAETLPPETTTLSAPDPRLTRGQGKETRLELPHGMPPARVSWMPVTDARGRVTARYAFWVEDLQGKIDLRSAGNRRGPGGTHVRNAWPFPAAGVNPRASAPGPDGRDRESALEGIALHALDPADPGSRDGTKFDNRLLANRRLLVSPGSFFAAADIRPPLARDASGRLDDALARAMEESTVSGVVPYDESPRVPFLEGIPAGFAGRPKLNLNALLARPGSAAVGEMAEWIGHALPEFGQRAGGFPEDYLKTLAANAIDYADADGDSTQEPGRFRGLDAYPLVSEFLMRLRWDDVVVEGGRKRVLLRITVYAELWNLAGVPVEAGTAEMEFDTRYSLALGVNPGITLGDPRVLRDRAVAIAEPPLVEHDDGFWFPMNVPPMAPDERRIVKCGEVRYRLEAGPEAIFVASPVELENDDARSGYRFAWNGRIVDGSRGKVRRDNATLYFPQNAKDRPRQKVRATVPALTGKRGSTYSNNPGDPRMAFYLAAPQDANAYPANYSPARRNLRRGTIYDEDAPAKPKVQGRVLPSEWPDGGHDASYGAGVFLTDDPRVDPDDPRFFRPESLPSPRAEEAPMKISNRGRFYSATELGHLHDPVMWNTGLPSPPEPWPDVGAEAAVSADHGGGNTLRIGRPEHPRFDRPGMHAVRLLDLFHAGKARSEDSALRQGPLVCIEGHVNLNTATRDALRCLAAGVLRMDPLLSRRTAAEHEVVERFAPPGEPLELSAPTRLREADRVADAILGARPFASPSQLAEVRDVTGRPVFGNRLLYPQGGSIQWSDAAAEELFGRVHDAATVRSRNFRVWVVGQVLEPMEEGTREPVVLAEVRKVFSVFADPGERDAAGNCRPGKNRVVILDENTF